MTESPFPSPWYEPTPIDEETPASAAGLLRYGSSTAVDIMTDTVVSERDDRFCGARRRQQPEGRADATCRRPAGWGTNHVGSGTCKLHGGSTRNSSKAAQKAEAVKARDTYGLPRDVDPAVALLEEVHRTAGHVAWLGAVVAQLRKGDLGWGVTKVKNGGEDYGTTYEAKLNVYLTLYQQERKHLASVCKDAIAAGVEEKRLTLETHRAELVITMLGSIFDSLELTPEQAAQLEELVPKALTAIAGMEVTK